ncbi:MAG: mycofactocin biosynthesis peptidyl-dipeptidase MftE [Streptomycetaceae bacterium]|nr:mycofactocin biosynthesis peptidyl-dipeptidase MftE [Streptomycetaceae bacterium]
MATAAWPDVPGKPTVLLPTGATEQHGPHLPLCTDTVIARAVADRAAALLPGTCLVAPAVPYGASGEHADFPGTVSLGHDALHRLLVEAVRSLASWAARVVVVNGHGGNTATLDAVVGQLRGEGHDLAWSACAVPGGDAHAGAAETSVMLHLAPELVHADRLAAGDTRPLAVLLPELRAHGVRAVSPTGVLGDPTHAEAGEGRRLVEEMTRTLVARIAAWQVDGRGRLRP